MTKSIPERRTPSESLYALGALTESERAVFDEHLETSRDSVNEVMALLPITRHLVYVVPTRHAPPKLRERVLQRITGATAAAKTDSLPIPKKPTIKESDTETHRNGRGRTFFWFALAIALAGGGWLGWFASQQVNFARALQENLDFSNQSIAATEFELSAARQDASALRSLATSLAASDMRSIALEGQPAAPNANARVFWSQTEGVVFVADGLPMPPPGRRYQVWLVSDTTPISGGMLPVDGDGRASLNITLPPEVTTPVPIAVSIEPINGSDSPSGEVYLLGRPTTTRE